MSSPSNSVQNEPVFDYAVGSPERAALKASLAKLSSQTLDMPLIIGGKEVRTGKLEAARMPHAHQHVLGNAHLAGTNEVKAAIDAAARAWPEWSRRPWQERAAVFNKAADLLAGEWRQTLNAATMLNQSKTAHQAEIDSAAELIDFWRFNSEFVARIHAEQPISPKGVTNSVDYRSLEGFVYAVTPFNFTAIAGNLPSAPALMGNTILWKPSAAATLSAHYVMQILKAAGLPDGVINLVYGDAELVTNIALANKDFAGLHFTGSTSVFKKLLQQCSANEYRSFPRIVGETGGKNFTIGHASADIDVLATAIVRGAFEYQGQKCSATSRVFVPESLWPKLKQRLLDQIETIRVGDVRNFRNFMGAVINENAWRKHDAALAAAKRGEGSATVLARGKADMSEGYFVQPTLLQTTDPASRYMKEEFFGPIATAYVYKDASYDDMLKTIDATSDYGLTGAVVAEDQAAVARASDVLRQTAGNFYINDKSTGAVVGQQPFGGARASGTNDKAGSLWNLARWMSPRTIKENHAPPKAYEYPFLAAE